MTSTNINTPPSQAETIARLLQLADPAVVQELLARSATAPKYGEEGSVPPQTPKTSRNTSQSFTHDSSSPEDDGHLSSSSQSWDESPRPKKKVSSKKHSPSQAKTRKEEARKSFVTPLTPSSTRTSRTASLSTPSRPKKTTSLPTSKRASQALNHSLQGHANDTDDTTLPDVDEETSLKRFVVGLDYGTTFTSVSYLSHPIDDDHPQAFPSDIKVIMNWPEDGMGGLRRQVPTEAWYSSIPKQRPEIVDQFELLDDEEQTGPPSNSDHASASHSHSHNTSDMSMDDNLDDEDSSRYLWGYDVPYQRFTAGTTRDELRLIARPKLMLVRSEHTREDQARLRLRLSSLIAGGLIRKFTHKDTADPRDVQDVITDFLVEVFNHTKQQLIELENYSQECPISFVLTVPVIWNAKASRVLQYAVEAAIRGSGFGTLHHGSVDNLFIVTEPEAAATYLLGNSHEMLAGETFIVLDCGGGTVDCVTYTVTSSYPLRLKREVGKPSGDNCGASYLNDYYEKHLLKRLANEDYLDTNGETRESIVRHLVPNFENHDKRSKDISRRPCSRIKIPGLRGDRERGLSGPAAKGFDNNFLILNPDDYNQIFMPLLRRVGHVLWSQIETAVTRGKDIKKVFLIGGFGACPSLRSYLKDFLRDSASEFMLKHEISLITTNDQESLTAVSSGAVLRALNKEGGPERRAICSYGFLRIQYFEPKKFKGHQGAKPFRDPFDQDLYVESERLLCEELLYVSDLPLVIDDETEQPLKSNYPLDHSHNRDAQVAGRIITDFTFLREEGKILPIYPESDDEGELIGKAHYEVTYDLIVIVDGRNLKYEARYPSGQSGKAQKIAQISLAAGFVPGTG
ncbi:uncharacterized protein LY89DRAFT_675587 [Mollisia scopiformis]|uniref:Uncharacterized protein n=1 Tax=Mollisia scopiformis TaxID=149040 RepID=A0A132BCJ4_MOLSC|nr:uncharacterized protein LY89DRAFT_675587 [Mollisia scopiformis]KUJ10098.1 hypothetical protein LY89DRAFT_675587 [Mollisia scopiformis]